MRFQAPSSEHVQVKQVVVSCAGVAVRGIFVPPFEVHRGHVVTVRLPIADNRICDDFAQGLVGLPPMERIRVFEQVFVAKLPIERRQTRWLWSRESPISYLEHTFNLQKETARGIIERQHLTRFRDFRLLPHGPRMLLALEGAFHAANACVFRSDGLDPENLARAYAYVSSRLRHGASAIELSTPYYIGADLLRVYKWSAHPEASCVDAMHEMVPGGS